MDDGLRRALAVDGTVDVTVRVRPNAGVTRAKERMDDGTWKVDVAAVPEDGKANKVLRRFVAAEFAVPVSAVSIVSGETARTKRVRVVLPR